MLKRFSIIIFFSYTMICFGQKCSIESIRKECEMYLDSLYGNFDNLSENWYIEKGKRLIKITDKIKELDTFNITAKYLFLATGYLKQNKKDLVNVVHYNLLKQYKENPNLIKRYPYLFASMTANIVYVKLQQGMYHESYKIIKNAIKSAQKYNLPASRIHVLSIYLGNVYLYGLGNLNKAEKIFKRLSRVSEMNSDNKAEVYVALGNLFQYKNLDSAYFYYKKSNEYFSKLVRKAAMHSVNTDIARIFIKKGEIEKAEKLLIDAEKYQSKGAISTIFRLGTTYLLLAKIANLKANKENELKYLLKSEKYLKQDNQFKELEENYLDLSNFYRNEGKFSQAFLFETKSKACRDSLLSVQKSRLVAQVETKFKIEKKESEIKSQQQLINFQKKQTIIMAIGIAVLLLVLGIATWFYRQRIITQKELLKNQEALNEEKVKGILESHKLQSTQAYISGQNEERERIAKDLHDSVSGNLAAIKLKLSDLCIEKKEISDIIQNVESTYEEVRAISHNLRSKELLLDNFTDLLLCLISFRESENLSIYTEFYPKEELNELPEKIQVEIYSIIQEALTNIYKHANASKVTINIIHHEDYINIIIEDNGIGFDNNIIKQGIGLRNMKERVKNIRGVIYIESEQNKGTIININALV